MGNEQNNKVKFNEILKKVKEKGDATPTQDEVQDFLNSNLSGDSAKAVSELLGDKEKTQRLLNSQAAKELFNKFFGGKDNG